MRKLLIFALFAACSNPQPKPVELVPDPDPKVEFKHEQGLIDTFSYRRMTWGASKEDIVAAMKTEPSDTKEIAPGWLLTFPTSTQGVETTATFGLWDTELVTIDIAPNSSEDCDKAVPKWTKALTIKYGTPADQNETFVVWKLADNSRIVIEAGLRCSIIYAKDAKTRVEFTKGMLEG